MTDGKKHKFVAVRVDEAFHARIFKALKKAEEKEGRPMKLSEFLVPALKLVLAKLEARK